MQKKILILILVIILTIGSIFSYYFHINDKTDGINAMENIETVDELATQWNSTAKLYYIIGGGEIYEDGSCDFWFYEYVTQPPDVNDSVRLSIKVYSNGTIIQTEDNRPIIFNPLENWSIDSDSAVEIAKLNEEVSNYLSKYPGAKIDRIAFVGENTRTNGCLMNIEWTDPGFADDPHSARIWIDATNGEVIDVEADN